MARKYEVNELDREARELTTTEADATEGGIIIVGGRYFSRPGDTVALNPQPLPPRYRFFAGF
jgi:hypothetical protein